MKNSFKVVCLLLMLAPAFPVRSQYVTSDTYTRYELLVPETHQFRIYYEVTETTAGARFHFNIIRPGSAATDERVFDAATGKPLKFEIVSGKQAGLDSPGAVFDPEARYIKVYLAHPVPAGGECRLIIQKTYRDQQSYYREGDRIVYKRSLSIARNSVVLPVAYEIVSCSVAAQVIREPDGRLKLAFMNPGSGGPLEVLIQARRATIKK